MLCRVIDVATDRANILAGVFLLGEIYLCQYSWHGIVEIHHTLGLQVLITLWRMGAAINGRLCITLRYLSQIRGRLIYPFLHKDEGHDPKGVQKGKILETLFGLSDVNNSI